MKHTKVTQSDTDDEYYLTEDLEWLCKPSEDDPGILAPKTGAVPVDRETGLPLYLRPIC